MTDELKAKILRKSINYADFERSAFGEGINFILNSIWHEPKEKPIIPSRVLASRGLMTETFDYIGTKHSVDTLEAYTRWCYLEDILPKEK